MLEGFQNFCTLLGLYVLCCYLYDNLKGPILLLVQTLKKRFGDGAVQSLLQRYGKWAAITGATDGIGKAYARELARSGLNVVLISRTEAKLKAVAAEIEKEFKVQTKIIVADFTHGAAVYEHIANETADIPIGIFVNNVGHTRPGRLFSYNAEETWSILHTNIVAVTQLSRIFLQRMRAAGTKGAIVNISSGTELQPLPYGAIYAASKAYTRSLTLALQREATASGITVQLVSPWFVTTKLNNYSKFIMNGNIFIPDAERYARDAVHTLGIVDETYGYPWHAVQCAVLKLFPYRIRAELVARIGSIFVPKQYKDS